MTRRPDICVICVVLRIFLQEYGAPQHLHSFPTRRSSALSSGASARTPSNAAAPVVAAAPEADELGFLPGDSDVVVGLDAATRSEEHTSELQSPVDLVCRLLLEKKKRSHPCKQRTIECRDR